MDNFNYIFRDKINNVTDINKLNTMKRNNRIVKNIYKKYIKEPIPCRYFQNDKG